MACSALVMRALASLARSNPAGAAATCPAVCRAMATGAAPSKGDVVHMLDNRDDPDVDAAIRAYQQAAFKNSKAAPEKPEEVGELAAKVQRKYVAAQVVEAGIQNVSVPLGWKSEGPVVLRRYVQQLLALNKKAGFEDPIAEVQKRISEKAVVAETAKELLTAIQPLSSPEYYAAVAEALAAVEAETNAPVTLDGASAGYKKFAEKVKKVAEAHKLPWKLLVDAKSPPADEDARGKVMSEYGAWLQAARMTDASTEIEALKVEATSLLDRHLSKSADTIRKEQAAAAAALQKRIEAAKGAPWAVQYAKDLEALAAYDAAVAADPVNGPKVTINA